MALFNPSILGIMILMLLSGLVIVKRSATGTIFDKPKGNFLVRFVNSFNLGFLLAVNPLAAILLLTHREGIMDFSRIPIHTPWVSTAAAIFGAAIYVMGYGLMAWALICLGENYQLGGSTPRPRDVLVMKGPFRWIRHPMYAAALFIALGLAGLIPSWVLFGVFCIYLVLIFLLIPLEEDDLGKAYGNAYSAYRNKTRKLLPLIY